MINENECWYGFPMRVNRPVILRGRVLWYDNALEHQCNSSHPLKNINLWRNKKQKQKMLCLWRVDWETNHNRRMTEYSYVQTHHTTIRQPIDYWSMLRVRKPLLASITKMNSIKIYWRMVFEDKHSTTNMLLSNGGIRIYIKIRSGIEVIVRSWTGMEPSTNIRRLGNATLPNRRKTHYRNTC